MSNKETLEEAAERNYNEAGVNAYFKNGFIRGAKWQAERMYSEIHLILENVLYWDTCPDDFKEDIKKWLNDYKQNNEQ
jgi:hypothetical protein